jgi:hypothetical protein
MPSLATGDIVKESTSQLLPARCRRTPPGEYVWRSELTISSSTNAPVDPDSPLGHSTDRQRSLESKVALEVAGLVEVLNVSTVGPRC